jgi:5-methylthioadenosine/S-adenosylhomocysteine deaminase
MHKLYGPRSQWIGAEDALTMCLKGGAKVLRKKVGSLQSGNLADLVILGTDRLFVIPKKYFINQLVFGEAGSSVETVLVGGQIVVEDRVVKSVNEKELYTEAKESIQKLYKDIPAINKRFTPALDLIDRMDLAVADYKIPFSRLACMG